MYGVAGGAVHKDWINRRAGLEDPQALGLTALVHGATRVEAAPRGDVRRIRGLTGEDLLFESILLGHDGQQRFRVRMLRVRQDLLGRADLDDAAEVHDRD